MPHWIQINGIGRQSIEMSKVISAWFRPPHVQQLEAPDYPNLREHEQYYAVLSYWESEPIGITEIEGFCRGAASAAIYHNLDRYTATLVNDVFYP